MRWSWIYLMPLLVAHQAAAQSPYPTTAAPQAWGGYPIAEQVPYQPTLGPPAHTATVPVQYSGEQAQTLSGPVILPSAPPPVDPQTGQVWQTYPDTSQHWPPGSVHGAGPLAAPMIAPSDPAHATIYASPPEWDLRASLIPPDARDGFFQKARFTAAWIPQLNDDSLGWTDVRAEVMTALPFFTRENPILITPAYEIHFLNRPEGFDLPPRLHDLTMDFRIFRVCQNRWIFDASVTPGLFADEDSLDSSDALRFNGRAVGVYAPAPEWKWLLGAAYVNGGWNKIVPIAGVVYEPNDDIKYELVFPRPRVAWRLPTSPVPGRDEFWLYVLGEFATQIWAFERSDGGPDILAYRDLRLILGLERKVVGGLSHRVEAGYVFRREMKIASISGDDIGLDDSFLLRLGVVY